MSKSEWKLVSPSSGERDSVRKNADSFMRLFEMVGARTFGYQEDVSPYDDFLRRTAFIAGYATVKMPRSMQYGKQDEDVDPPCPAYEVFPKDVVAGALLAQYAHFLERKRSDLGYGYRLNTFLSMMVEGDMPFKETFYTIVGARMAESLGRNGPSSKSEITFSLAVTNLISSLLLSAEQSVLVNTDPDSTIILDGLPMAQDQLFSAQERFGEIKGNRPLLSSITDYLSDVENGLQATGFSSIEGNRDVVFGLSASTFARCRI